MTGHKTWLKFFIDIIFCKKEHNWADTTFSKICSDPIIMSLLYYIQYWTVQSNQRISLHVIQYQKDQ